MWVSPCVWQKLYLFLDQYKKATVKLFIYEDILQDYDHILHYKHRIECVLVFLIVLSVAIGYYENADKQYKYHRLRDVDNQWVNPNFEVSPLKICTVHAQ
jgi:hypothetical protein